MWRQFEDCDKYREKPKDLPTIRYSLWYYRALHPFNLVQQEVNADIANSMRWFIMIKVWRKCRSSGRFMEMRLAVAIGYHAKPALADMIRRSKRVRLRTCRRVRLRRPRRWIQIMTVCRSIVWWDMCLSSSLLIKRRNQYLNIEYAAMIIVWYGRQGFKKRMIIAVSLLNRALLSGLWLIRNEAPYACVATVRKLAYTVYSGSLSGPGSVNDGGYGRFYQNKYTW